MTKTDLGYKPDAFEKAKFEYSPIDKVFTDGLAKDDKSKKVGLFNRLKNIEDNLVEVDDNDNKVGMFRIIKDIKDKDIKIDNDDEAVREIRQHIKKLVDDGIKINNFYEMKEQIMEHITNLENQVINVKIDEDQINDLINKLFDKKDEKDKKDKCEKDLKSYVENFLTNYEHDKSITYNKNKLSTKEINESLKKHNEERIGFSELIENYNKFMYDAEKSKDVMDKRENGAVTSNQKSMLNHVKKLKDLVDRFNPELGSGTNKKVKILTKQQVLSRLPILLAQIQAGNISQSLKNEIYS